MAEQSSITELAASIRENVAKVEQYLRANELPLPSFLPDGPVSMVMKPKHVEDARIAAIGASMELLDLLQGPVACLRPSMNASGLEALYRWNIPKHVPLEGEISFGNLARRVGIDEPNLRRIVRYVIVWHRIFRESQPGFVAHSAASRLLIDDAPTFDAFGVMFDETVPAYARTCDALQTYGSEEMNQTGYSLAHCPGQTMWEYYKTHPTRGKRFASSIKAFASTTGQSISSLVSGYPWSSLPEGSTIVDVGGSKGHASVAIAEAHPSLKLIVQDLPEVINEAKDSQDLPEGTEDHIEFMTYDFLTPQTIKADIYLFRWIFHDWPDAYVIRILQNQVPELKNGAKIVINDQLLPVPGSLPLVTEKKIRFYDMLMLSLFNAREREEGDWKGLFREADKRFQNIKIWTPPGSALSIVEATWVS